MLYKNFFWDFDGTLYATYGRITRACLKALGEGGAAIPYAEAYRTVRRSIRHFSDRYAAPLGIDHDAFMQAYRANANLEGEESIRPYPGIREITAAIARHGGRNFLYTHRGVEAIYWLKRDGLWRYFFDGVTQEDDFPLKPAPDALLHLMEKHGLNPAECIMLGDREIDIEAGLAAGMSGALYDDERLLPDYHPPYRFSSWAEAKRRLVEAEMDEEEQACIL